MNISVSNYNIIRILLVIIEVLHKEGDKIMTDERNNNQIQRNQQRPYFTDSQVITGCLATGEQRVVRRSTQLVRYKCQRMTNMVT